MKQGFVGLLLAMSSALFSQIYSPDSSLNSMPEGDTICIPEGDTICIPEDDTICIPEDDTICIPENDTISVPEDDTISIPEDETISIPENDTISVPEDDTICIIGTGDIMLGTNYPSKGYLPPNGDCSPLLANVKSVLQSGDVTFGNLEGVFCAEGGTPKKCKDTLNCYVFRMPDEFISCVVEAGYDVLSVANNHVNDFGYEGRMSTARIIEEAGIPFAGFVDHPYVIFEKGGLSYGFAAFAPHIGTVSLKDYKKAAEITSMLDSLADIVIISFHGGAEGKDHQHLIKGDEVYLGYNRGNTYKFAHTVVDAGADVVFGHGPHVTRAIELYNDRLICYSLGNFATYRRFNLRGPNGIAPIVKVKTNRDGEFLKGEIVPVYQTGEGGPRIDPQKRVIEKLQTLNGLDFPDQAISIDDDGSITRKR